MRMAMCAAAMSLVFAASSLAETVKNPEYENWARFKPGAMSKLETKSVANGQEIKAVMTNKLIEVTPEKLVIETTNVMEVMGQRMESPAVKRDVPAEMDKAVVARSDPAQNPDMKASEETIMLNGKEYKCKVISFTSENNGMKSVSKTWSCDEVPGGIVQSEVKITGGIESTTEMKLVESSTGG